MVAEAVRDYRSDHYTKKFDTYSHLVTMLFVVLKQCTSLREVEMGMSVCHNKLQHLGLSYVPARSTLAEANIRRDSEVFASIHQKLYRRLKSFLPDSRTSKRDKKLYIIDSTTVSLFQQIMGTVGNKPMDGKRKGGYKVHTLIKADEDVPRFVRIGAAASHDSKFLQEIKLPVGSLLTFDKGYVNYKQYRRLTQDRIWFVTRTRVNAVWTVVKQRPISTYHQTKGIISDQDVVLGHTTHDNGQKAPGRIVEYRDQETGKKFVFFTNNRCLSPVTITQIYQKRWQIEILFKRIKQNYPLHYFLGDNENAIRIQTWCMLIADLLIKVVKAGIKRKWSFSGVVSIVRQHLLEYINLSQYLEHPEMILRKLRNQKSKDPPDLFTHIRDRGLEISF